MATIAAVAQARGTRSAPPVPMEGTVLDPPFDAEGMVRVEVDLQPGRVRACPWTAPLDLAPAAGDAALVFESDHGNRWAFVWPVDRVLDAL